MAVRKRATKMTAAEKKRFRDVLNTLIATGTYGQLASHHLDMSHRMHSMGDMDLTGRQRFLPWHRVYLLKLEQAMQAIDSLSFIPYWKWTTQRRVPPWLANFMPTVNVHGQGVVTVLREVGEAPTLPTRSDIDSVMEETTYTNFTAALEFEHNAVHLWVGGTMASFLAPADPLFWLHHAQIDRLWSNWQAMASNSGENPSLSGSSRIMDPWLEIEQQVRSIAALGYSYGA